MQPGLIALSGSPHDMGVQHGRMLKDEIHLLAAARFELAVSHAAQHGIAVSREACLRLASEHLPHQERYSPAVHEEFIGIAEGAGIGLEELLIANALTDFRDVLWQRHGNPPGAPGCTSFLASRACSAKGVVLIGQTWDMHANVQQAVHIFHRSPRNGPQSLVVSTSGCLSLIGLNEAGVAVGNNNLEPLDARPGVMYLAMIHAALLETDLDGACRRITGAPRSSGHNYILADSRGGMANIETTAEHAEEVRVAEPFYVHTNHYLSERLARLEMPGPRDSTKYRLRRMTQLFEQHAEPLDEHALQRMFSDREGGELLCVCREGSGCDVRSCAFVVMSPETREMWVTVGPPSQSGLTRFGLAV